MGLIMADIFDRAAPWTRLILEKKVPPPRGLNLSWMARLSGGLWTLTTLFVMVSFFENHLTFIPLICVAIWGALNLRILLFYQRSGGIRLALGAAAWLWLYYGYSLLGACIGTVDWFTRGMKQEWMKTRPS